MDKNEALSLLRQMLYAGQHARSVVLETQGDDHITHAVFTEIEPWLFGPKSYIAPLAKYIGEREKGAPITGSEFYNWMWIAHKTPAVTLTAEFLRETPLPEPDMAWHAQVFS